jgi:hypothetical protein
LLGRAFRKGLGGVAAGVAREDRLFLLIWAGFILLFFSASDSKLIPYILPIFPPLAVLCGSVIAAWSVEEDRACFRFQLPLAVALGAGLVAAPLVSKDVSIGALGVQGWVLYTLAPVAALLLWGLIPLGLPRFGPHRIVLISAAVLAAFWLSLNPAIAASIGTQRSGKSLALAITSQWRPGDLIAQHGTYLHSVPFYTQQLPLVIGEQSELEFGKARIASERRSLFPDEASFRQLWQSDRRIFCVFERSMMAHIREWYPTHRLIAQTRRGILVSNR